LPHDALRVEKRRLRDDVAPHPDTKKLTLSHECEIPLTDAAKGGAGVVFTENE
jgi:hypothetical protein